MILLPGLPNALAVNAKVNARRQLDYAFASRGFHEQVSVHALNEINNWGRAIIVVFKLTFNEAGFDDAEQTNLTAIADFSQNLPDLVRNLRSLGLVR